MTTVPTPVPNVLAWEPQQQAATNGFGALQAQTAPAGATVNAYLNCNAGSFFALTLLGAASTTTVQLVNMQPGQKVYIEVAQSASGSDLITWINFLWAGGTPPTLTTTASHKDCIEALYDDVAARWIGKVYVADYS